VVLVEFFAWIKTMVLGFNGVLVGFYMVLV
jgi:hypothetical protein